jgi:hypothetical protein
MRFLLKALVVVAIVGGVALVAYALLFDLPAPQRDVVIPVEGR